MYDDNDDFDFDTQPNITAGTSSRSDGKARRTLDETQKQQITVYVVTTVVTCLIAAVIFVLGAIVSRSQFSVYMKFLFIPFFAFFAGFFNTKFMRKCKGATLIVLPVCFLSHLIFAGFAWSVFLWLLLYAANWAIGVALAVLVMSYTRGR